MEVQRKPLGTGVRNIVSVEMSFGYRDELVIFFLKYFSHEVYTRKHELNHTIT
jgi:hypothetical protein